MNENYFSSFKVFLSFVEFLLGGDEQEQSEMQNGKWNVHADRIQI